MTWDRALSTIAMLLAAAALAYTAYTAREDRNAALVQVGVGILRADPNKEPQLNAAREWALDLIDANAGGVKFSPAAREELKMHPLAYLGPYTSELLKELGTEWPSKFRDSPKSPPTQNSN